MREWRKRDPLIRSRAALDPSDADRLDAEVESQIEAALAFAQSSPIAGPDAIVPDHYAS